jgi:hypothetical protein
MVLAKWIPDFSAGTSSKPILEESLHELSRANKPKKQIEYRNMSSSFQSYSEKGRETLPFSY